MIKSLLIKNFILIDELFLEFDKGFNVLTGETGSGKSIILKAIDCVMGARVQKDVIFDKTKNALIEITFLISPEQKEKFAELSLEDEIVISREITQSSQKYRLNGAMVNLETIKSLREALVDIHSQNQSYTYVAPKYHIELLDEYSKSVDEEFKSNLEKYKDAFLTYNFVQKKLTQIRETNSKNLQEIDFLKFQLNEIDSAQIQEGEEEQLNIELEKLSNIQELKELTYGVYYSLGADGGVIDALSKMKAALNRASEFDNKIEEAQNSFIEGYENFKYCSDFLREYSQNLEANPQRLDEINERISLILKLKRKYGDIFETRQKLAQQLEQIEGDSESQEELEKQEIILKKEVDELSEKLSQKRKVYAEKLSSLIVKKLVKLELPCAKFEITIKDKPNCSQGKDDVEFLITTNVSSPLMPLAKVASGGEISRVMLAIKTVFATVDLLSTVIFDEIDTGISGKASGAVADAICDLAQNMQVFAITHQPIIASKANAHFKVEKVQDEKTNVSARKLQTEEEKLQALASLASGEISEASVSLAKELLERK